MSGNDTMRIGRSWGVLFPLSPEQYLDEEVSSKTSVRKEPEPQGGSEIMSLRSFPTFKLASLPQGFHNELRHFFRCPVLCKLVEGNES